MGLLQRQRFANFRAMLGRTVLELPDSNFAMCVWIARHLNTYSVVFSKNKPKTVNDLVCMRLAP